MKNQHGIYKIGDEIFLFSYVERQVEKHTIVDVTRQNGKWFYLPDGHCGWWAENRLGKTKLEALENERKNYVVPNAKNAHERLMHLLEPFLS